MPESQGFSIPERVTRRAFTKWVPGKGGCHISTYSVASHGYAQIGWQAVETGRMTGTTAHRAAWTHVHGQIPKGMTIDHRPTCDRRCVNVKHLRLLSNYENGRRTQGRDWPVGQCVNGHSNNELVKIGSRIRCRICNRAQQRSYYERNRERYAEWQRQRRARKQKAA